MISEEDVKKMLDAAKPAIIESFKKEITESATYDIRNKVREEITTAVVAWVKGNEIPEIALRLAEEREGLISLGTAIAEPVCDALSKELVALLKKKLENSYDRGRIFEALFK